MSKLSATTFTSPMGVFPISKITPAMVRALDSVDDYGRIQCSTQVFNQLAKLGLVVHHGLTDYITHAGWNAIALFPLPNQNGHAALTQRTRPSNDS
jgi:hypothetical protein